MNKTAEKVASYLLEHEYFVDFKLRKRDSSLIKKFPTGHEVVELQNWIDKNHSSGKQELVIYPVYGKRFDVLHKWFEKFSFKTMSDQRDSYSVGFSGVMLGKTNEYRFPLSETPSVEWDVFRNDVVCNAKYVFEKYTTLEDVYKYLVHPLVVGGKTPPDVGAEWVFEYLLLTKIVDSENYGRVKAVIMDQVEKMHQRREPNIERYYERFDEITSYLEELNN